MSKEIFLILADGTVYEGKGFGAVGETLGEVVFTTGMVGYLETVTDPCYYGQIVVQTFPLIGNYGVIPADFECEQPQLKGYIVREQCEEPSNFRSAGKIDDLLKEKGVIGLYDIDTRALTRKLRSNGVMNGMITDSLGDFEEKLAQIRAFQIREAVAAVTSPEIKIELVPEKQYKIALWDFGAAHGTVAELNQRGCEVITVPATATAADIAALGVDGMVLSDGPGNPEDNSEIIKQVRLWTEKNIPTVGTGLGHQLLALACGAQTEKMKFGHRGSNQPVRDLTTGRLLITSQNHGYTVKRDSLPENVILRWENVNDGTCEGLSYRRFPGFSLQFRPADTRGVAAENFFYDGFLQLICDAKEEK